MTALRLEDFVRDVPDFPQPGIAFKDITPLLADARAFAQAIDGLANLVARHGGEGIVAIESRGFILGAAVAHHLRQPLLLVRKPGKLPWRARRIAYDLEYGKGELEMHVDAVEPGRRYAIVDDVLATGGTAGAAATLVAELGGEVACNVFLIELAGLAGRSRLGAGAVESLLRL